MKSNINFHIHTTHSDGGKTVKEVLEELSKAGVKYFSITDHDKIEGNIEASSLSAQYNLLHFNGIELSCCLSDGELNLDESWVCHILGFDFDYTKMHNKLMDIENKKNETFHELLRLLKNNGYNLEYENIIKEGKILSRKTIAQELINKGYASNSHECYESILNTRQYKKYANSKPSIKEGIKIIQDCGGLAIWAHPFDLTRGGKKELTKKEVKELFKIMIEYNLDGLEVYYHKYLPEQIYFLDNLSNEFNRTGKDIIKSIGTDYHMFLFDEKKYLEYVKYREKESIIYDNMNASENLLGKVLEYKKAYDLAVKAHEGQKDKCREEYIKHLTTVSLYCNKRLARIAALLHDVVEDTNITLEELKKQGIAEPIILAVNCLTKRTDEEMDSYYNRVVSNVIATEVKFADMRHNSDCSRWGKDKQDKAEINKIKYFKRAEMLFKLAHLNEFNYLNVMTQETYDWFSFEKLIN